MLAFRKLLSAMLAFSAISAAAEISGRVLMAGEPVAGAVLSIEGLQIRGPSGAAVYVIDHKDLQFTPHVLVIHESAAVQFHNSDGMPCRLYSISPSGIFALRPQEGKPLVVEFDRPGIIELRCADHARIHAYIVVKENPYFALTNAKGRYQIGSVPPGRYTVQAWYEGKVIQSKTVELRGSRLNVDFRAPRIWSAAFAPAAVEKSFANILNFLETIK